MRLSIEQQETILHVVAEQLGVRAQPRRFDALLDDSKRSGDVDLTIKSDDKAMRQEVTTRLEEDI